MLRTPTLDELAAAAKDFGPTAVYVYGGTPGRSEDVERQSVAPLGLLLDEQGAIQDLGWVGCAVLCSAGVRAAAMLMHAACVGWPPGQAATLAARLLQAASRRRRWMPSRLRLLG